MKATYKKYLILGLSLGVLILSACEKEEEDRINKAQECLDKATVPADAVGCAAIIDGINSEKANRIRCALVVLENGITQSEIIAGYEAMDNGTAEDPVVKLVTILGLGDVDSSGSIDAADVGRAQDIKDICYQSSSQGLRTVSELILFGTRAQLVAEANAGDPTNPSDIAAQINNMSDADAGEFGNSVFDIYCVPTYSNNDICITLATAGAGTGSDAAVGAALKACLQTNTCTPP